MSHTYSFSRLRHGGRQAQVFSSFIYHPDFPSYIVQLSVFHASGKICRTWQKSFSRIDLAEAEHQRIVLRLAVDHDYKITSLSCK